MRTVTAECAPSRSIIDAAARSTIALILAASEPLARPIEFASRHPIADALLQDRAELIPNRIRRAAPGRSLQRGSRLALERPDGKPD